MDLNKYTYEHFTNSYILSTDLNKYIYDNFTSS